MIKNINKIIYFFVVGLSFFGLNNFFAVDRNVTSSYSLIRENVTAQFVPMVANDEENEIEEILKKTYDESQNVKQILGESFQRQKQSCELQNSEIKITRENLQKIEQQIKQMQEKASKRIFSLQKKAVEANEENLILIIKLHQQLEEQTKKEEELVEQMQCLHLTIQEKHEQLELQGKNERLKQQYATTLPALQKNYNHKFISVKKNSINFGNIGNQNQQMEKGMVSTSSNYTTPQPSYNEQENLVEQERLIYGAFSNTSEIKQIVEDSFQQLETETQSQLKEITLLKKEIGQIQNNLEFLNKKIDVLKSPLQNQSPRQDKDHEELVKTLVNELNKKDSEISDLKEDNAYLQEKLISYGQPKQTKEVNNKQEQLEALQRQILFMQDELSLKEIVRQNAVTKEQEMTAQLKNALEQIKGYRKILAEQKKQLDNYTQKK